MDKWMFYSVNSTVCCMPLLYVCTAAYLSDIRQSKLHFHRCLNQSFSSTAIILVRLKRRGVQLNSDLSSADQPQFSKCLNPDDPQML